MHQPDPNSSDVKCIVFVIVYLCIPEAGFDAIFDWYLSMLGRFFYLHIIKSTPYNQSCKRLGFLIFIPTFMSHLYVLMCFHLVALIVSLKWRLHTSSRANDSQ